MAIPEGPETANFSHLPLAEMMKLRKAFSEMKQWVGEKKETLSKKRYPLSKDSDTKNFLVCYGNTFWFPSKFVF